MTAARQQLAAVADNPSEVNAALAPCSIRDLLIVAAGVLGVALQAALA